MITIFENFNKNSDLDNKLIEELGKPWGAIITEIKKLLNAGANPNIKYTSGVVKNITPLISAARQNATIIIDYLLDAGANINDQDSFGNTALLNAANLEKFAAVCKLIERGADLYIKNNNNNDIFDISTPYHKRVILINFPKQCERYIMEQNAKKYNL